MVTDAVNVDRVESLLRMIYHRRRFLRILEERRLLVQNSKSRFQGAPKTNTAFVGIPAIVVDTMPMTPSIPTRDITQLDTRSLPSDSPLRSSGGIGLHSPDASYRSESPSPSGAHERKQDRRLSDLSMLSGDIPHQYS